ncbi:hypothetical protein PAXINDRAFT_169978 [Paxillus involutus ATCC 200175]|uniref:Uncharacterized protein n=1 Tax=Paxillus involutus ATCC 200175 TaxID=664439 RepID=A0A0C9TEL3_PAXIN|nr:hypothetical protein PAXINDRAFT_169978 [Paxillus involutus ATCC 200175]
MDLGPSFSSCLSSSSSANPVSLRTRNPNTGLVVLSNPAPTSVLAETKPLCLPDSVFRFVDDSRSAKLSWRGIGRGGGDAGDGNGKRDADSLSLTFQRAYEPIGGLHLYLSQ